MAPNRDPHRSKVPGTLLLAHDEAACNTSRTVTRRDRRGSEHAFPLPDDVVGLICRHCCPVGYVCACGEVSADQPHGDLVCEAEHGEAYDERHAVEYDDWAAQLEFVAEVRGEEGRDDGVVVRWSREQDRFARVEAHAALQDNGQEIAHACRDEVLQEIESAESVDLEVADVNEDFAPGEWVGFVVATIVGDARAGHACFGFAEEVKGCVCPLWEVRHPPIGEDAQECGDGALHDEHPLPALQTQGAIQQIEAVVDEAAGCEDGDLAALHQREADLLLLARVVNAQHIREPRVDAGHGDTE